MNFSDFSLKSKPAVRYQVDNLRSICEQFQILLEGYRGLAKGLTRIKSPSDGDDISERSSKVWSGKKQDNNLRGEMMKSKRGFTLVEILIVVVILGILAAIVIPQFTGASTEAKLSSLVSDLQTIRSQIELYKLQHNEVIPSMALVAFGGEQVNGLTGCTLVDGTQVAEGTDDSYGPYLMKMPTNQFNNSSLVDSSGTAGDGGTGAGALGWEYDTTTGEIWPDYVDADGDAASDGDENTY